ncbi:hypothetical protein GCM10027168_59890 [Streptomyces capparidis]
MNVPGTAHAPGPGPGPYPGAGAPSLPAGYRLLRTVGQGRYATVHLCLEEATGHEVAVKVADFTVASSSRRLAAHSELLAAGAAAGHPCAVTVEDAGFTEDRRAYQVMRFCRGGTAEGRLAASGAFPVEEVLIVGVRLALALHASHRAGVLHLDVRPGNVLYDEHGDALLAGHGVTRVFQRCAPELGVVFDPLFAAREMFGWEAPGPAADVYALGATLYTLLTGRPPHADAVPRGWAELYRRVLSGELPHPGRHDVPPPLLDLLARMMSPQAEGRPPLTEVHRVLRGLVPPALAARVPSLEPEPAPEPPLPGWDPAEDALLERDAAGEDADRISSEAEAAIRRRNRNRILAATTALVLFAGAATAIALTRGGDGEEPKAKPSSSPGQGAAAQQVPAKDLPNLRPGGISLAAVDSSVQVTWQAPRNEAAVAGYVVSAVSPDGRTLSTKSTTKDELQVVFTKPPVASDTCYLVIATVATENEELKLAPAEQVCGEGGKDG